MYALLYDEATYEIIGNFPEEPTTPVSNQAAVPPTFEWDSRILWIYNPISDEVEMKTGQALADAQAVLNSQIAHDLIGEYFAYIVNPVVQGKMEEAADLCVQALHHFMNGTTPTQQEVDNWNLFYTTNSPYFKIVFAGITQEIVDDMKDIKQQARATETLMKQDPRWPYP